MNRAEIESKVRLIIAEQLCVFQGDIGSSDLLTSHSADSLDMAEIHVRLMDEFKIDIADAEVQGFHTIDNIVRCVEEKLVV